jgi:NADPH-dependent ferric siderophore reductase
MIDDEGELVERPHCSGEWQDGSGAHRTHAPCSALADWWHPDDIFAYCEAHVVERERRTYLKWND